MLAGLMLLAFLIDQIQEHACRAFQRARERWRSRRHLWERLRGLVLNFYVPDWTVLMAAWSDAASLHMTLPALPDTS
ncbi:hypothetical protein [Nitrococcus mobilis]|uniref:Transposase n=1 Tax=Nitrococcus mobilis Nb-231 TaxID=314278 RepID=A4BPC1_9GAMM|nr:hypothetical protein [Nitrococcus mobilis]EAR22422.1 hypothetical protein NB231_11819 [Nitrococcus mobilis Nb-231]